jgi:methionyl-tRNA formyltransferase
LGCINIHGSLLPRWRGAAPSIAPSRPGDAETGITIMQMEEGLDTGPMMLIESLPITDDDTTGSLHDKLAALGGKMIVEAMARLEQGALPATPQPEEGANYAAKIAKEEAALDFSQSAQQLARRIRAFNPFPGATGRGDTVVKLWQARPVPWRSRASPARCCRPMPRPASWWPAGEGALLLTELQKPGGKRLPAAEFLKGFPLEGGRFA